MDGPLRAGRARGDQERRPGQQAPAGVIGVAEPRAAHRHGVDSGAEVAQVVDGRGHVALPAEGQQRDLVPGGSQVAQDVIGAHLGPGVEGIGDELGEEEEAQVSPYIKNLRWRAKLAIQSLPHNPFSAQETLYLYAPSPSSELGPRLVAQLLGEVAWDRLAAQEDRSPHAARSH